MIWIVVAAIAVPAVIALGLLGVYVYLTVKANP